VMALSPLGKRRGGGSVAAMASVLPWDMSEDCSGLSALRSSC